MVNKSTECNTSTKIQAANPDFPTSPERSILHTIDFVICWHLSRKSTSQGRNLSPQCLQNPHLNHDKSIKSTQTCMWWSWKVIFIVFDIFVWGIKMRLQESNLPPRSSTKKTLRFCRPVQLFIFLLKICKKVKVLSFSSYSCRSSKHKMSWDLVASKLRDGLVFSPHAGITFRDRSQTTQDDKTDENDMIMRRKKKSILKVWFHSLILHK